MTDTTHALAVIPGSGIETYRASTDAATLCGDIVKATATKIQGKRYVCVEGWLAIAAAHGCLVSIREVEAIEGGIRAVAELRRINDQALLATAEGFVGDDEPMWAKRPLFARRAMVQTRASSRVCRAAFAFVVVLIDKELGTTPAEEMQGVIDHVPGSGPPMSEIAADARRDGLTTGNGTQSQYAVDKLKKAVAAGWKVTNTTPKGQLDQIFDYLDMARNADDIAAVLNANIAFIEGLPEPKQAEINDGADKLLRWHESQAAGGKAAA